MTANSDGSGTSERGRDRSIRQRVEEDPEVKGAVLTKHGHIAVLDEDSLVVAKEMFGLLTAEVSEGNDE